MYIGNTESICVKNYDIFLPGYYSFVENLKEDLKPFIWYKNFTKIFIAMDSMSRVEYYYQ